MTPVVLSMAVAVVAALAVLVVAGIVTGGRTPGPAELVESLRSALRRPREVFAADDDLDGDAGRATDVLAVGEPADDEPDRGVVAVLGGPVGPTRAQGDRLAG